MVFVSKAKSCLNPKLPNKGGGFSTSLRYIEQKSATEGTTKTTLVYSGARRSMYVPGTRMLVRWIYSTDGQVPGKEYIPVPYRVRSTLVP